MSVGNFKELKSHIGHKIVCVGYGLQDLMIGERLDEFDNVAIECETCKEVLLSFDR